MISLVPEPYRTAIAFILVLGVLIFIHELGHLLAARWRGVRVERFSIGFGERVAAWTDKRGTEWTVGWIPLGGYVRLHGQNGLPKDSAYPGETFYDKPVLDRALIVVAGPVANFLLAALLFMSIFAFNGKPYTSSVITRVSEGSPAEMGGLKVGDHIVEADGIVIGRLDTFQDVVRLHPGTSMSMVVERDGARVSLEAVPDSHPVLHGRAMGWLGMAGGITAYETMSPIRAMSESLAFTGESSWRMLSALSELVTGKRSASELGGPIRIAQMSGEVASNGLLPLLGFTAFMSVNLALMNLLPVPSLDGGHLVFYAIEAVRGKPLSPRVADIGLRMGMACLISFMAWTTLNDLSGVGLFDWLVSLFA